MCPERPRLAILRAVLLLSATALFFIPQSALASPARYVYEICDSALPGGGVSGVGYTASSFGSALFSGANNCSRPNGSLSISRVTGASEGLGSAFFWRLRNANTAGPTDQVAEFGAGSQTPVVGDWDGDGIATIGTYEPESGIWRLRNSNTSGSPDVKFQYGGSQFRPVVGDWDGNGTTTIGLYEPNQGRWELRNSNTSGNPHLDFQYGDPKSVPVPGDWDGNGSDTVGWAAAGSTSGIQGRASWTLPIAAPPGGTMTSITATASACRSGQAAGFLLVYAWPLDCQPEQTRTFPLGEVAALPPNYAAYVWLECEGTGGLGNQSCAGATISARYIAVAVTDPVPPVLSDLRGSLLSGNVLRGRQGLEANAHDEGGGLDKVWVSINGSAVTQTAPPNCNTASTSNSSVIGTVAYSVTPCPTEMQANWVLDTQRFPFHNGANAVQVCASDFATLSEPNTTCLPTQSVNVDNSCAESAVGGGEQLSARFARSNSDVITVRRGGAQVVGSLKSDSGAPLRGATLCIASKVAGLDGQPSSRTTIKTDSSGRYSYTLPQGPNREVTVGYRHDTHQLTRAVRFYSHGRPTLVASPRKLRNLKRVRFRGHLPGPANGGRVIVLQANPKGSKRWITFRRATTNARGVFRGKHRFVSTTRTTVYRFRAIVPDQVGYPWLEGVSRPVKVKVRSARR